ncbi:MULTISPECIES: serine hydrolase domain-containing protein [Spirosoma]|uniref:Beta-lactamase family protein n=1 Tax=Spirosoma liriopis TaxID=2937440 RepID=A0ABT0HUC6_9BACT|nr:serine hydrolase domain-containing protein [Spirosoma oryzicola]MCK8495580.1 beta-lactamase family protein [Spirosoma liriopis]UHG94608.1 beta-lactamase family protein [Spirosoma oryzicola]
MKAFTHQLSRITQPWPFIIANRSQLLKRYCLLGLLTPGLISCSSVLDHRPLTGAQPTVQQAVDDVRLALEDSLRHPVPSLNVLIQTPTRRVFASSVPGGQPPVRETDNFRFASITKHFTATALLNMHEAGWIDYKAKITDLIPGTQTPYVPNTPEWGFPYKNQITIEQLLQHRAGVFDVDNDSVPGFNGHSYTEYIQLADPTHQFTTEEMVHQLIVHKLFYDLPGTAYHYSNTGYSILGKIIARVYSVRSGSTKTYQDYMRDYIVGATATVPLASLHFPDRADDTVLPIPRIEGLEWLPGNVQKRYADYNMSAQVGEGNGYGTMADLHTYIRTLMKGQNVLTLETVKRMQLDDLGGTFRLNLGYGKNGARIGNIAVIAYDPLTDVSVVAYLPLWDLTEGKDGEISFGKCINALYDATFAARSALGYSGKP